MTIASWNKYFFKHCSSFADLKGGANRFRRALPLGFVFGVITSCCLNAFASANTVVVVGHAANFSDVGTSAINPYNKAVTNGLELAIADFKKQLEQRRLEIKIEKFDYGNKEIQSLDVARKIAASPAVAAIGFYESGQALLAAPILESAGLPLISPVSSATRLFEIGPHIHHMSFSNEAMGLALTQFSHDTLKAKSALIVDAADCAYCADLANSFEKNAKSQNITVERIHILDDDSVFASVDQVVAHRKFDVYVIPNHELTSAKVIAHLLKLGISGPFVGGDGWGNAEGSAFFQIVSDPKFTGYCIGHWHPKFASALGKKFIEEWQKKFGEAPSGDSAMAYESMRFLILAILKADHMTRQSIQDALASQKKYDGVTGTLRFKKNGASPQKALVLLKSDIKEKKFEPVRTFELRN